MSSLVFFAGLYVVVNAWSAIDIFVFGRFDGKFGGPMDNLILGLELSALAFAFCALGCLLAVAFVTRWLPALRRGLCRSTGAVAAAVALGLLAAGLFPWFEGISPLAEDTADMALAFVMIGVVAGLAGAGAVAWVKKTRAKGA